MQGCGGETPYCLVGVLMFLEYGVQCLPLLVQNARSGPSRCSNSWAFSALTIFEKQPSLAETALVGRFGRSLRAMYFVRRRLAL